MLRASPTADDARDESANLSVLVSSAFLRSSAYFEPFFFLPALHGSFCVCNVRTTLDPFPDMTSRYLALFFPIQLLKPCTLIIGGIPFFRFDVYRSGADRFYLFFFYLFARRLLWTRAPSQSKPNEGGRDLSFPPGSSPLFLS